LQEKNMQKQSMVLTAQMTDVSYTFDRRWNMQDRRTGVDRRGNGGGGGNDGDRRRLARQTSFEVFWPLEIQ
jgi:hypothetical protein